MRPGTKLLLLVLGAAGAWAFAMLGLFLVFLSLMSDTMFEAGNNTGALAGPLLFGAVYTVLGFVGAFLVALLLSVSVAALNEIGVFEPWSRPRVRIWALTTSLVTLAAIAGAYRSSKMVRSSIEMFYGLFA